MGLLVRPIVCKIVCSDVRLNSSCVKKILGWLITCITHQPNTCKKENSANNSKRNNKFDVGRTRSSIDKSKGCI